MKESFQFIYRDARGNITLREVVSAIPVGDNYLQCFNAEKNEVRTFRRDRILEIISDEDEAYVDERLKWYRDNAPAAISRPTKEIKWNSDHSPEICLTGFKKEDKERLTELAESKGFYVASKVTSNLKILVCGYNAGPAKKKRAQAIQAMILSEPQFGEYLNTGEIPEDEFE